MSVVLLTCNLAAKTFLYKSTLANVVILRRFFGRATHCNKMSSKDVLHWGTPSGEVLAFQNMSFVSMMLIT